MKSEPNIHTIQCNGLTVAYLEAGYGPLVLCLHGYPDTAHTWGELMTDLANAGYRVVAPFMRGYPPTEIPADGTYSALDLGQDIVTLIDQLGQGSAIVVGHDWGALAAYTAANLAPEKISKMITVAIPHPRSIQPSLRGLWKSRHFITYQSRRQALRRLQANNFAHVDQIYRRWSPTWRYPAEETQRIKETLAIPGAAAAALGYYWSFGRDTFGATRTQVQEVTLQKSSVPTLCIVGAEDGALDLTVMPKTERAFSASYQYQIWQGVGHFLHREQPERFSEAVLAYLSESQN